MKYKLENMKVLDTDKFINFLEELCWLLESNRNLNFKKNSELLHMLRKNMISKSSNDDGLVYNLIGVLPTLLKDETIFSSNSSLVQFAQEVLSLNMPRWEKRSRNELIGLIICNVEEANRNRLETLAQLTQKLLNNKEKIKDAIKQENIFSWNDTIQKIIENK